MALHAGRAKKPEPAPAAPMDSLYEVADLVERANAHLMDAAKIAHKANMPAIHFRVTAVRAEVDLCQVELASWTGGRGE